MTAHPIQAFFSQRSYLVAKNLIFGGAEASSAFQSADSSPKSPSSSSFPLSPPWPPLPSSSSSSVSSMMGDKSSEVSSGCTWLLPDEDFLVPTLSPSISSSDSSSSSLSSSIVSCDERERLDVGGRELEVLKLPESLLLFGSVSLLFEEWLLLSLVTLALPLRLLRLTLLLLSELLLALERFLDSFASPSLSNPDSLSESVSSFSVPELDFSVSVSDSVLSVSAVTDELELLNSDRDSLLPLPVSESLSLNLFSVFHQPSEELFSSANSLSHLLLLLLSSETDAETLISPTEPYIFLLFASPLPQLCPSLHCSSPTLAGPWSLLAREIRLRALLSFCFTGGGLLASTDVWK